MDLTVNKSKCSLDWNTQCYEPIIDDFKRLSKNCRRNINIKNDINLMLRNFPTNNELGWKQLIHDKCIYYITLYFK
jgi:hypothetical protein